MLVRQEDGAVRDSADDVLLWSGTRTAGFPRSRLRVRRTLRYTERAVREHGPFSLRADH
jgi:hypothetical protein